MSQKIKRGEEPLKDGGPRLMLISKKDVSPFRTHCGGHDDFFHTQMAPDVLFEFHCQKLPPVLPSCCCCFLHRIVKVVVIVSTQNRFENSWKFYKVLSNLLSSPGPLSPNYRRAPAGFPGATAILSSLFPEYGEEPPSSRIHPQMHPA